MPSYPRLITNVETQEPFVALTFDDGPHPIYTPRVLQVLAKYQAKATFFMVGEAAQRYPEIVRMVAEAGHAIGNHSWDHPYLPRVQSRFCRLKQLWACAKATAPYGQRLFRPPFGAHNDQVLFDARIFRYTVIMWNVSAQDWMVQEPEEIKYKIIERVSPGSIFLLHDAIYSTKVSKEEADRESMIVGLGLALDDLKKQIDFVTIPDLLQRGAAVSNWSKD